MVKKRYTLKTQSLVSPESKMIYEIASSKGKIHDFKMFKDGKTHISSNIKILSDSGYQGIKDIHCNSRTPTKKKRKKVNKEVKAL